MKKLISLLLSMAMVFSSAIRADRHSACSLFHSIVTSEAGSMPFWVST